MHALATLLPYGAAARHEVTLATSASSVARWTANGDLVHLHPGVVILPAHLADPVTRARAAALWAKAPVSHISALRLWGLVEENAEPVHVTVPADRFPRNSPGVVVHRTTLPLPVATVDGIAVTPVARSLVDAWAWSHGSRRGELNGGGATVRQAVIECVRSRRATVSEVRAHSGSQRTHAGRGELRGLLDLLAGGRESELEIWGVTHVLPGPPDLPPWVQQHEIRLDDGRRVRLDAAYVGALVAVELDGAAFHGSRAARERDLRRDTALAALGWVVLRFSYARLMADPRGCRREIETVVRRRLAARWTER